jgi:7-cyano-7-deazaguanine synthase
MRIAVTFNMEGTLAMLLEQDGRRIKYATLLSGGVDSATLLYDLHPVPQLAVTIEYGQRHDREIDAAKAISSRLGVEHVVLSVTGLLGGYLLGGSDDLTGAGTVVPGRNGILISLAANVGLAHGCNRLAIGCNASDRETYADCREEYLQTVGKSLALATGMRLSWPYVHKTKAEIIKLGESLGVPFDVSWSCYSGGELPCGECGACVQLESSL